MAFEVFFKAQVDFVHSQYHVVHSNSCDNPSHTMRPRIITHSRFFPTRLGEQTCLQFVDFGL